MKHLSSFDTNEKFFLFSQAAIGKFLMRILFFFKIISMIQLFWDIMRKRDVDNDQLSLAQPPAACPYRLAILVKVPRDIAR